MDPKKETLILMSDFNDRVDNTEKCVGKSGESTRKSYG